jgi:hypothetical protein
LVRPSDRAVAGSGTVKFDTPHRVRAVNGRQLGIAGATLSYPNNRLYRVEGNAFVAGGVDAMRFQQSLDLT